MYPTEIAEFAESLARSGQKLQKNYKNGITPEFKQFIEVCLNHNIDIKGIFGEECSFNEIIHCVKADAGPLICYCGSIVANSYQGRRWCSIKCRSNDKSYCKNISDKKTQLYNNPFWKEKTESKKVATTLEHYGVKYPMQSIDIFERQQAACFEKDENGLHGYEPYVYGFLKQLYPSIQNGTTYLKDRSVKIIWGGSNSKEHRSYPDFFCNEINSFIEVKGDYTRKLHHEKLMKCKDELYNMGYGYYICVVNPKKTFSFETYNHRYIIEE